MIKKLLNVFLKGCAIGAGVGIGVAGAVAIAAAVSATFQDGELLTAEKLNALKTAIESLPEAEEFNALQTAIEKAPGDYILIRDEKPSGTPGGDCIAGSWATRDLNTEKSDAGGHASLSSNQIILAAGTYYISASAPAYVTFRHRTRLFNVTDGSTILLGTSEATRNTNYVINRSIIKGQFTIAGQKTLELQHRCEITAPTYGFGVETDFGEVEVYSVVELWRIGD